nr:hypothetical protein [uncultured Chryseobacterium sp.]
MDIDFRKLLVTKLFDFSKEEEKLIIEIFDQLSEMYTISVVDIQDSAYYLFKNNNEIDFFKEPKLCYHIISKAKDNSFYLFIINTVGVSAKGMRTTDQYDTLEILGLKELDENFGFIAINKKNIADKIAGVFSRFVINFKEDRDFRDFYVLGSAPSKTKDFLTTKRKETIQYFPEEDFKLEVKNDILAFGLPKAISLHNALIISKFLEDI